MIITEYNEQWDKEASFNDGVEFGIEKGIKKGIAQGIEKGVEKNKLEMVRNLLALNVSLEKISKASGLTEEEILQLAKN